MRKILLTIITSLIIISSFVFWYRFHNLHRFRLLTKMISGNSLDEIKADYAQRNCREFSDSEINQGRFEALVTGYCRPQASDFPQRADFLCAVGLNCSCPAGREPSNNCALNSVSAWSACLDFNDQTSDYCHQTATLAKPGPGQIAADWSCFAPKSTLSIDGHDYLVTDKGSAIKGRRFDIWFDNCDQAFQATGIYDVVIP
jgi:3D (Asp-Asp-Asp) domain-containing protein